MVVMVDLLDLLNVILKEQEKNMLSCLRMNEPMLTVVFGSTWICERVN